MIVLAFPYILVAGDRSVSIPLSTLEFEIGLKEARKAKSKSAKRLPREPWTKIIVCPWR